MILETFIAESAVDAVRQIRAKLGPDAEVVNLRQLPSRWFQKPKIEVQARAPEPVVESGTLLDTTDEPMVVPVARVEPGDGPAPEVRRCTRDGASTARELLESIGLLPLYAERVLERLDGSRPPWLAAELKEIRAALASTWIPPRRTDSARLHVFVGAPGVGKTTVLCKWLTLSVLLKSQTARVWRLDGDTANTAAGLSVHADVLGVPVDRSWNGEALVEDIGFVDLPGVNGSDAGALRRIANRLREFGDAQLHLVVNVAYETSTLLAQARTFVTELPVAGLVVTHLDEEPRWGRLWNLMLGTDLPIRVLSAGQNIPGEFYEASPERVLTRVFAAK
jgi:flagellar biosynthesis GTPase FlhF